MLNKKGVTDTTLVIGAVVIAAIIISLGAVRFIVPFIKTAPQFVVLDGVLTVNTVYSAPDDMTNHFVVGVPKDCIKTEVFTINKKFTEKAIAKPSSMLWMFGLIGGAVAETTEYTKYEATSAFPWTACTYAVETEGTSNGKWTSDSGKSQDIVMQKTYDNSKRSGKFRMGR